MMKPKAHALFSFRCLHPFFFPISGLFSSSTLNQPLKALLFSTSSSSDNILKQSIPGDPIDTASAEILRKYGCSDFEISKIFISQPYLRKANPGILQLKLNVLHGLGLTSSDVVKLIHCRPRLLNCRIDRGIDERIKFLKSFFGSREMLFKAILRNPTLLKDSLFDHLKRCIAIYEGFGITRKDLIPLLISRPTVITRTKLDDDEKLDYIRRTGLPKDSKMYKYVVSLIAVSRIETIREKLANLAKFGFSDDEVMAFVGRSPMVLTLSVDKVQRNMTFILGTMKLNASTILYNPFLLFANLETVLKPRVLLAEKIKVMGLEPQIKGPAIVAVLRMPELRFLEKFVNCHDEDVSKTLLAFYKQAKCVKRLAEGSKRVKKRIPVLNFTCLAPTRLDEVYALLTGPPSEFTASIVLEEDRIRDQPKFNDAEACSVSCDGLRCKVATWACIVLDLGKATMLQACSFMAALMVLNTRG